MPACKGSARMGEKIVITVRSVLQLNGTNDFLA